MLIPTLFPMSLCKLYVVFPNYVNEIMRTFSHFLLIRCDCYLDYYLDQITFPIQHRMLDYNRPSIISIHRGWISENWIRIKCTHFFIDKNRRNCCCAGRVTAWQNFRVNVVRMLVYFLQLLLSIELTLSGASKLRQYVYEHYVCTQCITCWCGTSVN